MMKLEFNSKVSKNSSLNNQVGFALPIVLLSVIILGMILLPRLGNFVSWIGQNNISQSAMPSINLLEKDQVTIGLVAGLGAAAIGETFYPYLDPDKPGYTITSQFMEGLVSLDKDFKIQPLLAKQWKNVDENTWRFELRENVKFSNGDPFDANDMKFTFDTVSKSDWDTARKLSTIKEVKVVSPYVVEIVTSKPDLSLLNKLATFYILSRNSFNTKTPTVAPVGTGPYLLTDRKRDDFAVLMRNENYWGEKAKVKKVTYKVIPDDAKRVAALLNKELDFIEYVPTDKIEEFKKDPALQVLVRYQPVTVWYLGFDTQRDVSPYVEPKGNPFKDIRVREAMYHAINIDELVKNTYNGFAEPQSQLVTKYIFGYNPEIKRLSYDPEKAKQLLKEAGYPDGFKVNIDVRHPRIAKYGQEVVRQLAKIGINAKMVVRRADTTGAADRAKFEAGDISMYMTGAGVFSGDSENVLTTFLHSPTADKKFGVENLGGYKNDRLDKIIENLPSEPTERLKVMQEAMKIGVVDDIAMIPLNVDGIGFAFSKDINWSGRVDTQIRAYEISGKPVN